MSFHIHRHCKNMTTPPQTFFLIFSESKLYITTPVVWLSSVSIQLFPKPGVSHVISYFLGQASGVAFKSEKWQVPTPVSTTFPLFYMNSLPERCSGSDNHTVLFTLLCPSSLRHMLVRPGWMGL